MLALDLTGAKPDWQLEERIARLEDLEAIRNLKMQYAFYCDRGYDPEGIGSLFVEDGVWEANVFGTYHGVEAIKGFFASVSRASMASEVPSLASTWARLAAAAKKRGSSSSARW